MDQAKKDYKEAMAKRDFETALGIVLANPDIFWTPPSDVPVEIAAIATDPLEPKHMLIEWSVRKKTCKKPKALCSEYSLRASQFDHKPDGLNKKELEDWMQPYIDNRIAHAGKKLGLTMYLVEVVEVRRITDFNGEVLP